MVNKDFQNGFIAGAVSGGVVEVIDTTEIDNLEDLIDNSGVLEDAEGTVTEKVEELVDKVAYDLKAFECITNAVGIFREAKTFPTKAIVNLPNVTSLFQTFSYWNMIVEELTVNAPNLAEKVNGTMTQAFFSNVGIKKIILNLSNEIRYMNKTFSGTKALEEVFLNFSTKNVTLYTDAFYNSTVKKIIGVLDFSSATDVGYMFVNSKSLEDVTFEPNTLSISITLAQSSKLTAESVQSIIDGLATVETAQTLTLNKAIVLTDEQKATINAKGWTLAQ